MADLAKLRGEHAALMEIATRLSALIAEPQPPTAAELFAVRGKLNSVLIAHLKAEDWVLYPRLFASPDPAVERTARAFSDEMGDLAQTYTAHTQKWTATSIASDWNGYCKETGAILDALGNRIVRENRELYPLLEALDKAA
jgi:iron-sulfur cluster repair protein YtfE (RIC family)